MFDAYAPTPSAQYAELASEARNAMPDDRNGCYVLRITH